MTGVQFANSVRNGKGERRRGIWRFYWHPVSAKPPSHFAPRPSDGRGWFLNRGKFWANAKIGCPKAAYLFFDLYGYPQYQSRRRPLNRKR